MAPGERRLNTNHSASIVCVNHVVNRALTPYLKKAADKVGPIVSTRLRESLRKENASADMVLLVGGGAGFFELAIRDAFPQLKVSTSDTPVFANVRGFWRMGV